MLARKWLCGRRWASLMTGKEGSEYDFAVMTKTTFKQAHSKQKERKQWQNKSIKKESRFFTFSGNGRDLIAQRRY
jgi:hypothetical protein